MNVDNIYSFTNYEPSHYELDVILKSIKLRDTGFPQLTADDVLKHKVLMEYGTPHDFDGKWHRYKNNDTRSEIKLEIWDTAGQERFHTIQLKRNY